MQCKKCGKTIKNGANVCPYCKTPVTRYEAGNSASNTVPPLNGFAIAGFVLGLVGLLGGGYFFCIIPLLGEIFSALGLKKARETDSGRKIAKRGLIISAIGLAVWLAFWLYIGITFIIMLV